MYIIPKTSDTDAFVIQMTTTTGERFSLWLTGGQINTSAEVRSVSPY